MLNANQPFQMILSVDPAIDTEAMGSADPVVEYAKSRDFSIIAPFIKPGSLPMLFQLRRCSPDQVSYIQGGATAYERQRRAFSCCVEEVENLVTVDGAVVDRWRPASVNPAKPDAPIALTADELALFYPNEIAEVGLVAETRSFLGPRYAPRFELPPGLHATLTARSYRHAAPSPAPENNNEASSSIRSEPSTSSSNAGP